MTLALLLSLSAPPLVLPIAPISQDKPSWCWLAVGKMVMTHAGVFTTPVSQCALAQTMAAYHSDEASVRCSRDCGGCDVPANDLATVIALLVDGPRRQSWQSGDAVPRLFAAPMGVLSHDEVWAELNQGRPIVLGINPTWTPATTQAQHLVLLVGVEGDRYIINDPYDYGMSNPYLRVGGTSPQPHQFSIDQASLRQSLGWVESIVVRKHGTHPATTTRCLARAQSCPTLSTLAVGATCSCGAAAGVVIRVR